MHVCVAKKKSHWILFSSREPAQLKKVFGVLSLRNQPPAGLRGICAAGVLRPADWHNAVCESSGFPE